MRRTDSKNPNALRRRTILLASAAGLLLFLLLTACCAALLCVVDISFSLLPVLITASQIAGCLLSGFLAGKTLRHNGLCTGLICALLTLLLIRLTAMLVVSQVDCLPALIPFLLSLCAGGAGGIWGVNTKNRYLSR